jgi:two-component system nitrogen regulation response regulator GlnG
MDEGTTLKVQDTLEFRGGTIGLSILAHPSPSRIGEIVRLTEIGSGERLEINRSEPEFCLPAGGRAEALATMFISRKAVAAEARCSGSVRLTAEEGAEVVVEGEVLVGAREWPVESLQTGLVLVLSKAVALLLHFLPSEGASGPDLGLFGESSEIRRLRAEIRRVADLDEPVLLRGETGVGKELVARAIHACSRRHEQEYVCVNIAAIPPTLAASELFGHRKSGFSGADHDREGYFRRADKGTLFLDEIGDAPSEIQVALLRVLEQGQIQVVGDDEPRKVNVRLIAATDTNIDEAITQGKFRLPLLQRLGYPIVVPPLRARRDDIGRLFIRFLREELAEVGEAERLADAGPTDKGWLRASLIDRLVRYSWPGNVRQLRNVAHQLAISNRGLPKLRVPPMVEQMLSTSQAPVQGGSAPPPVKPPRDLSAITDDVIIQALRDHRFNQTATAAALNVSRSYLDTRMNDCDRIRKACDIGVDELRRCCDECDGDLDAMVARLEVSKHGLKQQMRRLGLR